ncbi:hypothetical protein RCJ88_22670, partial [Enterobacter hormaechei]|nr:hypothetical protein [Enterobacter hormaechei]
VMETKSTVDGESAVLVQRNNASLQWTDLINAGGTMANVYGAIMPDRQFTAASPGTVEPMAATTFSYGLSISLAVDLMSNLNLTDDTLLDGSATFTLVYL